MIASTTAAIPFMVLLSGAFVLVHHPQWPLHKHANPHKKKVNMYLGGSLFMLNTVTMNDNWLHIIVNYYC